MKTVKIGLIGCGRIAPKHVEGYQLADGAEISALCAPRLEKAYALADKHGLQDVEFFADYRDMLAQQDIVDAVDIMTPDYLHAPIVQDCAAAGLHILCEKPMALNATDASRMYDAAKKAGIISMIGLNMRFSPAVLDGHTCKASSTCWRIVGTVSLRPRLMQRRRGRRNSSSCTT